MVGTVSPGRTPVGCASTERFDTSTFTLPNHSVADNQKLKTQKPKAAVRMPKPESRLIAAKRFSAGWQEELNLDLLRPTTPLGGLP
jgi:hypothetical protein